MALNRDTAVAPNLYSIGTSISVHCTATELQEYEVVIKDRFEGQPGFGFTNAAVLLVKPSCKSEKDGTALQDNSFVLKIFDHTAPTALRNLFISKPYNSEQEAILQQSIDDGSLAKLWLKFNRPLPLEAREKLVTILSELDIQPDVTFGELVCAHVIMRMDHELESDLRRLGVLGDLNQSFLIQLHYLWQRFLFLHERNIARLLQDKQTGMDEFMPRIMAHTTVATRAPALDGDMFSTSEHPAILQEYIQGVTLADIEATLQSSDASGLCVLEDDVSLRNILFYISAYLHSFLDQGFVYEDIHPSQIIVGFDRDGEPGVYFVDRGAIRPLTPLPPRSLTGSDRFFDLCTAAFSTPPPDSILLCPTPFLPEDFEYYICTMAPTACLRWPHVQHEFYRNQSYRFMGFGNYPLSLRVRVLIEDIRQSLRSQNMDERTLACVSRLAVDIIGGTKPGRSSLGNLVIYEMVDKLVQLFELDRSVDGTSELSLIVSRLEKYITLLFAGSGQLAQARKCLQDENMSEESDRASDRSEVSTDDTILVPDFEIPATHAMGFNMLHQIIPQPCWNKFASLLGTPEGQAQVQCTMRERAQRINSIPYRSWMSLSETHVTTN